MHSMKVFFSKMHGTGNDFVVIDAITQVISITPEQIQKLAHRKFGIGFDQLLLVEPSARVDFRYRIFNADGHEIEQCGNGARCFARFVYDKKLTNKKIITVETQSGDIALEIVDDKTVSVTMGVPVFDIDAVPFIAQSRQATYVLSTEHYGDVELVVLSMGNPHAVLFVSDINVSPVAELGKEICQHARFPEQVNVSFVQVENAHCIASRVFERGVGETLSCGTGACASVVAGILGGYLTSPVTIKTRGGDLTVEWKGLGEPVILTGAVNTVFEGVLLEWSHIVSHTSTTHSMNPPRL